MSVTGHTQWDNDICFEPGFDLTAVEPDDVRLANLYNKTMVCISRHISSGIWLLVLTGSPKVCSDCFLKIMHQRLLSPLLRKGNWTDYLVGQHSDLQTFCSTSMPLTTSSATLFKGTVPVPTATPTASHTTSAASPSTTCMGQMINPPPTPMDCNMLSQEYNVTTGDLTVLTNDWSCWVTKPICAPKPCTLKKIGWFETW